jgi:hypothetical protein
MTDPRVALVLKFAGHWYTKAAELHLALFLGLYVLGCIVSAHPIGLHEFETFVHHVFDFHPVKK